MNRVLEKYKWRALAARPMKVAVHNKVSTLCRKYTNTNSSVVQRTWSETNAPVSCLYQRDCTEIGLRLIVRSDPIIGKMMNMTGAGSVDPCHESRTALKSSCLVLSMWREYLLEGGGCASLRDASAGLRTSPMLVCEVARLALRKQARLPGENNAKRRIGGHFGKSLACRLM